MTLEKILDWFCYIVVPLALLLIFSGVRVRAQENLPPMTPPVVTSEDMFKDMDLFCNDPAPWLAKLKGNPQFKKPIRLAGEPARELSERVWGYSLPASHIVLLPMHSGVTILIPCVARGNVITWGDNDTSIVRAVKFDVTYRELLENPEAALKKMKEVVQPDEQPKTVKKNKHRPEKRRRD